ncbi:glucokinase [Sphingomonas sp. BK235]|uniref:glucokinase n=1 Tax=Sphingomonas sp. BK235 TaxID=2512131 RepID=UPI001047B2C8|nr:glucokinase [Sphingomonas sp. BK235]TCP34218.1 glucokinase [Sphingomonas sp. BK235]
MEQADAATALVGHVGRKRIRFALADADGRLRRDTLRTFAADTTVSISGAIMDFLRDARLPAPPARSAFAVAGLPRGETVSITRGRWYLSRSGLRGMLGHAPLILNDFEAEAWALHGADVRADESFAGGADFSLRRAGTYCVLGMTSGLGVSVLSRDEAGAVHVLATEAGHGGFVATTDELARLAAEMFPGRYPVVAEDLLSAPGLVIVYQALARRRGVPPRWTSAEEITRAMASDPLAGEACTWLCRAFWSYAGQLAIIYGAWDGVIVTGGVAAALRPILRLAEMAGLFAGRGKYARLLGGVPRVFTALDDGELSGAAEALRHRG